MARSLEAVHMDAGQGLASVVEAVVAHSLEEDRNQEVGHNLEEDHNPEEDRTCQDHQGHTYQDQDRKDHDPYHRNGSNHHRRHPTCLPFLPSSNADPIRHNHHNQGTNRNDNNLRRCRYQRMPGHWML